jgi:hypothetical protein
MRTLPTTSAIRRTTLSLAPASRVGRTRRSLRSEEGGMFPPFFL